MILYIHGSGEILFHFVGCGPSPMERGYTGKAVSARLQALWDARKALRACGPCHLLVFIEERVEASVF